MGDVLDWELVGERSEPAGFLRAGCRVYRMPDGRVAEWDVLWGGRTVAVVALTGDGGVLLVRQFRVGPGRVLAELPGGVVEAGESVRDAAVRELLEETGYRAGSATVVGQTWLAAYATHRRYAVLARGCHKVGEPRGDGLEFVQPVVVGIEEFVEHVLGGQLTDCDVALMGLVAAGVLTPSY